MNTYSGLQMKLSAAKAYVLLLFLVMVVVVVVEEEVVVVAAVVCSLFGLGCWRLWDSLFEV